MRNNRSSLVVQPMPMIVEDENSPPVAPDQLPNRRPPVDRRASYASRVVPPPAAASSDHAAEPSQPVVDEKDGKRGGWFVGRRGWHRLGWIAFGLVALTVGLAVGLTLGLRKRNSSSDHTDPLPSMLFPVGSYSFTTALANVSTGCTSDPSVFRCSPFTTYSSSPKNSSMTLHWTITPLTRYSYAISSKADDPAPSFANLPMTLLDANQYSERLVFNFTTTKQVAVPKLDGGPATCWFNDTVMSVTLWTRIRASYPPGVSSLPAPQVASASFAPWPYMVTVDEVQDGGAGVPDCRNGSGNSVGGGKLGAAGECGCYYANFDLDAGGNATSGAGGNGTAVAAGRLARWMG